MSDEKGTVAEKSQAVQDMEGHWRMIADLMAGTSAMRAAGERHLPRFSGEEKCDYRARLLLATLFPAYARTVSILTGKPFSKPVAIGEDVPERLQAWLEDVDTEGRNLHAFAADVFADALAYGFAGILVDSPRWAGRTVADEKAAGWRPYFVHVRHDAVLGWRSEKRGGRMQLTQLRLKETVEEPDGLWTTKPVDQVRVLEPGKWETWRKGDDAQWYVHDSGEVSLDFIPFVPVYGFRVEFMVGKPPMLDLAHLNVQHWQSDSDQQTILHYARVPIVLAVGIPDDLTTVSIGPGSVIQVSKTDADVKFVEHSGSAIGAGRTSLLDLEDRMRQVGAELLVIKPGNTTEVQTRSDNEPAMCDLQRISQALEDALDLALSYMAAFAGEPTGGHVTIYSDFGVASQSEASAQLLASMQGEGALTHRTLLNELKRRGLISAEVDVDAEIAGAAFERDAVQESAARREREMLMAASAQQEMSQYPIPYMGEPIAAD